MQKLVLENGLTVLFERKPGASVVVQVMAKVGSNHEHPSERGISHFLEHILFEGTVKRPNNQVISNEIEKIGGDFNAYTTNERTCYYVRVLKKHFSVAVEVLSDIMKNSLFKHEYVRKEKNIVLKEIDMVFDEPRFYQWILLQKNLFKRHPARFPTYGDRKVIKNLTREQVVRFFNKHYVPSNMVISIVGDVKNWRALIKDKFNMPARPKIRYKRVIEAPATKNTLVREKRKIVNTYLVFGFKTVPRTHKDTYVLEVINGILGRGQSGKMFTEIRGKRGLAYDVGTQNVGNVGFGYFAVYVTIDKKNVKLCRKLVLEELRKLEHVTDEELKESKEFIEGDYLLELDDNQKVADQVLFWDQVGDHKLMSSFLKNIKAVSKADVRRVVRKYFQKHCLVVLEGR